ncbi:AAA family ATPase [Nodularia sp. UHCC 0506]|uniref:AAA family ATPase n=1 Tax=Nodularia sp. UHCC 0506 TaxID=3110243 RepID=UPI002B1F5CF4|nr:AAA family ATPase [Nodularia sp. UHCC 0506]MEA5514555.1 AAA family ATPase [Nodularia sp. UHCC 0506]
MQKIIINNFGAITNAEIEVKKILVLIGEQASGKSTISKLIYFFKSLKDDLFSQLYQDTQRNYFDIPSDLIFPVREKFYDFFGSTFHLPNFEIIFFYSVKKDKYLRLTLDESKKLYSQFSDNFLNDNFKNSASKIKRLLQKELTTSDIYEQLAYEQNKIKYAQTLSTLLNELFESNQTNSLFIIAGRNATISYSELFEKYLFASNQSTLEENRKKTFQLKEQTIDETLMLKFMERIVKIKEVFKKFGDFEGLIESYAENNSIKENLNHIQLNINKILKGKYINDNRGEKIVFNDNTQEYVYLSNASSGQQESIRILQDIFMIFLDNLKVLRIIEEPEAHLFPIAQKQLIELLALMVNQNQDNQLIITTHSPYVLTVFNNLLFAKRVVEKNPSADSEVTQIIPKDCWLSANDFSAYSLGNQSISETTNYCESIFSSEKGTIKQNFLDTVSEILGGDFQDLYSIHAQTFARK